MELLNAYFPEIKKEASLLTKFEALQNLYEEWNAQINVISRKDLDHFYERHVLHSLAIAKFIHFEPGTRILDIGTGGGFPGIPLAIYFPDVSFVLVDSIGKKTKVVSEVAKALELKNVEVINGRAEDVQGEFDFIVSRAVAPLIKLSTWTRKKLKSKGFNSIPNGFLLLKGGDLSEEIQEFKTKCRGYQVDSYSLSEWYKEDFFSTKKLLHTFIG